jgi:hypothetical protein
MEYEPEIWGPHYWFFLNTMALTYPTFPNDVIKKKYYDLIHNFSYFIPHDTIAKYFNEMLSLYPVRPYLDNKKSLVKWVHFIHNKINKQIGKAELKLEDFYIDYHKKYQTTPQRKRFRYLGIFVSIICMAVVYYLYNK